MKIEQVLDCISISLHQCLLKVLKPSFAANELTMSTFTATVTCDCCVVRTCRLEVASLPVVGG